MNRHILAPLRRDRRRRLHLHASSDVVYPSGSYTIARVYSREMTVRVVSKLARVT